MINWASKMEEVGISEDCNEERKDHDDVFWMIPGGKLPSRQKLRKTNFIKGGTLWQPKLPKEEMICLKSFLALGAQAVVQQTDRLIYHNYARIRFVTVKG